MPAPDYAVEIAALEKALASGELEIQSGVMGTDRVTYRSTTDLLASLTYFRDRAAAALPGKPSTTLAAFDRE